VRCLLALGTQSPEDNLRLFDLKTVIGGRLQTGSRANSAVYIGGRPTLATDNVMVIVSYPRFIARRVTGKLHSSHESGFHKNIQIIIDRLRGESPQAFTRSLRNLIDISMLSFSLNRPENGKARPCYSKTSQA
jgi:hypothetical protein